MTHLSPAEIARYARDAGFRGNDLTTAVAVAMAESGGNTEAHNGTPPDNSYGLWQINMIGDLGPARLREFGIKHNDALFRPAENASAAKHVFDDSGGSFTPWTTYTGGAYKQYLDEARRAVGHAGDGGGGADTGGDAGHHHGHHGRGSGEPDDGHHDGPVHHKPGTAWQLLHGAKKGFEVDTGKLTTYSKQGHEISEQVGELADHKAPEVRAAADAFGDVGKESGFEHSLDEFGRALRMQLTSIRRRVKFLSESSQKVADLYQGVDEENAKKFKEVQT